MTVRVQKESLNLREELSSLKKPSGVAGEAMLRAETPQEQFNLIGAGRKNFIINGDFKISQRGDYTSSTSMTNGAYQLDRWLAYNPSSTGTIQKTSVELEGVTKNAVKITKSSGTGEYLIQQPVETGTFPKGSTVTFSAWVRSNTPTAGLRVYGGSSWFTSNAHTGDGSWQKLSVTYVADWNDATRDTQCQLHSIGAADGSYLEGTDFQLELGSVATPFEHRSYGEELALCQRYFNRVDGANGKGLITTANYSTTSAYGGYVYPVKMRTTPTISVSSGSHFRLWFNGSNALCTGVGSDAGVDSCQLNFSVTSGLTSGYGSWVRFETTGWLAFDAEL